MDAGKAIQLAEELIAEHLVWGWKVQFAFGGRFLGRCKYWDRVIELSAWHVAAHDEANVRDTILHEIAHALAPPHVRHGVEWQRIAARIGAFPRACGASQHYRRKPVISREKFFKPNFGEQAPKAKRLRPRETFRFIEIGPGRYARWPYQQSLFDWRPEDV